MSVITADPAPSISVEPDVAQSARATLTRLEVVGWSSHGGRNLAGNECLLVAIREVTPNDCYHLVHHRLVRLIERHIGCEIPQWNDDPNTTWEDVRSLLLSIAEEGEPS